LVEKCAAINYTDSDGNTPLMVVAKNGKFNILRYLTNRSLHQHNSSLGFSLGYCAYFQVNPRESNAHCTDQHADLTPLHVAVKCGNVKQRKLWYKEVLLYTKLM
jgi:ankyrin repeat protein